MQDFLKYLLLLNGIGKNEFLLLFQVIESNMTCNNSYSTCTKMLKTKFQQLRESSLVAKF